MSARMPVLFVSHGAPDVLFNAPDTLASWREMGLLVAEPKAILMVSAHWEALQPTVSLAESPETIHDFSGFPPELYRMQYRASGAPALARRVASLLSAAGLTAEMHSGRGLDHGGWVPLSAMYPHAEVPVTQLSLVRSGGPAMHFDLGRALIPLREEGMLIVGSGAITHNFAWLDRADPASAASMPQASVFADWVAGRLAAQDVAGLLAYRSVPHGAEAHPTEEHFLPLFVALGAANGDEPLRYQPRFTYGSLAMDAYRWGS